jgi:hypothetical protein
VDVIEMGHLYVVHVDMQCSWSGAALDHPFLVKIKLSKVFNTVVSAVYYVIVLSVGIPGRFWFPIK